MRDSSLHCRFRYVFFLCTCLLACLAHAASSPMGTYDARHFLNRVGFGADAEDIATYSNLSRKEAVRRVLLSVTPNPHTQAPTEITEYIPPMQMRAMREEDKKEFQRQQVQRGMALRAWWLGEILNADTPAVQLRERMVLFWHNHFVSSMEKVRSPALMQQQNQLLRQEAIGNFATLLHAVGKDPAMVVYLDSASNRKGAPNENFAREVMELFTLGEGNYSEHDVKEAARAFTGWSIDPPTGTFKWRPFAHDGGVKEVLGQTGEMDGDDVLDLLLSQPQTAEFLTTKLWREFISPTPDMREVKRIARIWRDSKYDMRTVLSALLNSPAFWADENRGTLIKSPVELVVGTLHTFGLRDVDPLPLALVLRQLGQDLFAPPNVKGWPGGESWVNSNTLLQRKQFLDRIMRTGQAQPTELREQMMADKSGSKLGGGALRRRMMNGLAKVEVDVPNWEQQLKQNNLSEAEVLLALPPTTPSLAPGTVDSVRGLLLDTVYQLR